MVASAAAQSAAALSAALGQAHQVSQLPALFGPSACATRALCAAAFEARRNVLVATGSSTLWLTALATALMARTRAVAKPAARSGASLFVAVALGFSAWRLFTHLPLADGGALVQWHGLLALAAVATATCADAPLGALLLATALSWDLVDKYAHGVAGELQPTDLFVGCNVAALFAYALLAATHDGATCCLGARGAARVAAACDAAVVVGTSSAALLYLMSACAMAAASGGAFSDEMFRDRSEHRFHYEAVRFVWKHYAPLFVWLASAGAPRAHARHGRPWLYLAGGLAPGALWLGVFGLSSLASNDDVASSHVAGLADTSALTLGMTCAGVVWLGLAAT